MAKPAPLNQRQLRFVVEYLRDLNATQAAIRAGYSARSAPVNGPRLLANARVAAEIERRKSVRSERVEVSTDFVLTELMHLASADVTEAFKPDGSFKSIHDMPVGLRRSIASIELGPNGKPEKFRFHSKTTSLELLGKHLAMFVERRRLEGQDGQPLVDGVALSQMAAMVVAMQAKQVAGAGGNGHAKPNGGNGTHA